MLSVASKQYTQHGSESDPVRDVRKRMAELEAFEPPKLVVALEYDHWTPGSQDWHLETHRVLQQRDSQKRTEGEEDESERQDRLLDVLDFTGPGVL
ncbi:hypothetical protein QFC24_006545 [Naganishia onofrii]|uniref:Uncharacterized protein n=1 Tax=Naganishia onofrii TaxID=1851511 RepID=A0ACC2X205_9TREE|nr:hypothetical protein QFC24_006545 [Naganishia onofrii]